MNDQQITALILPIITTENGRKERYRENARRYMV